MKKTGITSDPGRRRTELKREYKNLRNFKVSGKPRSREAAQKLENKIAKEQGIQSHPGGRPPGRGKKTYNYIFEHDGKKK